ASRALERATALQPENVRILNWLGRAYGRRAEGASFLTAPSLAVSARRKFEAAHRLAPNDLEVIGDLFEYYLDAPAFLGGGTDKAEQLAARVERLDEPEYHYEQARLAEKHRELTAAERHYRRAAELAPQDAGRLIDLAEFYESQGRQSDSDAVF